MKKLHCLTLVLFLCTASFALAQQHHHPAEGPPPIHNGMWWGAKSQLFRDGFVTGYKSGSLHATGHAIDINQFPSSQLIDGIDSFYKDFRNRTILVDDVLLYVVDQLRGTPDDKLSAELLKMRAAAAPVTAE